jgi:hypothetical protein
MAEADIVGADGAVIVGICFSVGDGIEFLEGFAPAGLVDAEEQLIFPGIVIVRPGKGEAIFGMVREAHAVAIGLHFGIGFAVFSGRFAADAREQSARGITGDKD